MSSEQRRNYVIEHIKPAANRLRLPRPILILGGVGLFMLLGVALVSFAGSGNDDPVVALAADATPSPTPSATPLTETVGTTAVPAFTPLPPTDEPSRSEPHPTPTPPPTATGMLFEETGPTTLRIMLVGDVMLGRMVAVTSQQMGDPRWPFYRIADLLHEADLVIGNFEHPAYADCKIDQTSLRLCAPPESVEGLAWAGFDVVSLSNNHINDFGPEAIAETVERLEAVGVTPLLKEEFTVKEIRGVRVGVLADQNFVRDLALEDIATRTAIAAQQTDVLITYMHWGAEYVVLPALEQRTHGKAMIDNGATIVAGAHPHIIQRIDEHNGGVIFHSLGNFVFDQDWSDMTSMSGIADVTISVQNGVVIDVSYQIIPIRIEGYGQPRLITEQWELDRFCEIYPIEGLCVLGHW